MSPSSRRDVSRAHPEVTRDERTTRGSGSGSRSPQELGLQGPASQILQILRGLGLQLDLVQLLRRTCSTMRLPVSLLLKAQLMVGGVLSPTKNLALTSLRGFGDAQGDAALRLCSSRRVGALPSPKRSRYGRRPSRPASRPLPILRGLGNLVRLQFDLGQLSMLRRTCSTPP